MNKNINDKLKNIHNNNIEKMNEKINNAVKLNYNNSSLDITDEDIENTRKFIKEEKRIKYNDIINKKNEEENNIENDIENNIEEDVIEDDIEEDDTEDNIENNIEDVQEMKEMKETNEEKLNFNYSNDINIKTYNNNYLANVTLLCNNAINFEGIKNVTIDLLSIKDEKVLNTASTQEDYYNILYSILQSKVKDVNFYEIIAMDFETLLLNLRVKSCGSIVNLTYTCKSCKSTNNISYDLNNLTYTELNKDYKEPYILKVPIGDNNYKTLKLRLPRIKHRKLMNINEKYINTQEKKLDFLSVCCLDDGTKQLDTLFKEYEELPLICKKYITKFLEKFTYGYSTYIPSTCNRCKSKTMVLLPLFTRELFTKSEISNESFNEAVSM